MLDLLFFNQCVQNKLEVVKDLIECNQLTEVQIFEGFIHAAQNNSLEVVTYLLTLPFVLRQFQIFYLKSSRYLEDSCANQLGIIDHALSENTSYTVSESLTAEHKISEPQKINAIFIAALGDYQNILKSLLSNPNIAAYAHKENNVALRIAIQHKHFNIIERLLKEPNVFLEAHRSSSNLTIPSDYTVNDIQFIENLFKKLKQEYQTLVDTLKLTFPQPITELLGEYLTPFSSAEIYPSSPPEDSIDSVLWAFGHIDLSETTYDPIPLPSTLKPIRK